MGKDKKKKEKKAEKTAEKKGKAKALKAVKDSEKAKHKVTLYPESFEGTASSASVPITKNEPKSPSDEPLPSKKAPKDRPDDLSGQETDLLSIFQALSDENRLKIINLLAEKEMSTPELLESVHIVQSTMSHHMKVLCDAGLVRSRKLGKRSCYSIREDTLGRVTAYLRKWDKSEQEG